MFGGTDKSGGAVNYQIKVYIGRRRPHFIPLPPIRQARDVRVAARANDYFVKPDGLKQSAEILKGLIL